MTSQKQPVGFVGLGEMGFGMARNLLDKGHDVLAFDTREAPLQAFVELGGRRAASLAEIGGACDRAMVMVVSGDQVEAVLSPQSGLLQTMCQGTVLVHATIALSELRRIAELGAAHGITVIDCPVSGGAAGANDGTLTMLCGGDVGAFEANQDVLDAVSNNITHLGPIGAGMVGKLANNLILGIGRLAIGEAFAMAKKAGLSAETLYATMTTCTADSKQLRGLEGAILRGEYPSRTFHGLKDLTAAVDSGRTVNQAMPIAALTREFYQLIEDKSDGLEGGSDEVLRFLLEN
jgi:3-hydroxyisobutyrate dehydrogenase-like beta-hydroxyacid dehydrogenase